MSSASTPWDHPRVCGEHPSSGTRHNFKSGSSPRVRGTQHAVRLADGGRGIIPACAGNTTGTCPRGLPAGDHPRVCGEHPEYVRPSGFIPGSSPRVRGTLRVRGGGINGRGIIPACAGNTARFGACAFRSRDHPRVCGEHDLGITRLSAVVWIIPACAGNTQSRTPTAPRPRDHPRVCGEHS